MRTARPPDNQAPLDLIIDAPLRPVVEPEVSTPCASAFDNDEWLFGIDWDGSRAMLVVDDDGQVRLHGVMGPVTERFPEVAVAARSLPPGTVLDGILSILGQDGRPDLVSLSARIAGSHRAAAVFLATDVLRAGGRSLLSTDFGQRLAVLATTVTGDPHVQAPEPVVGQGVALAAAAASQRLGALLARRRSARYTPGIRSPDRLRIDVGGNVDRVVVGRRTLRAGGVELLLGEVVGGRLTYVNTERLDQPPSVLRWLDRVAVPVPLPPCEDAGAAGEAVTWLRPRLCATLRDPSRGTGTAIVAVRDDLDPRWCVRREPVPPPASTPGPTRAFTPTVLRALPLDAA